MKKLIVFILLAVLLALWGMGVILPDAGYVLVILGQKSLETSLWFACFAVLAVALSGWLITRFVRVGWSLAQRLTDFFVFGTTERASKRAASGLIDFLSGDWLQARKKLMRTASKVESPLVNYFYLYLFLILHVYKINYYVPCAFVKVYVCPINP